MIFIAVAPPLILLLWWWAPETKGRTLEEIGGLFGDHVAADRERGIAKSTEMEAEKASVTHLGTRISDDGL